MTLQQMEALSDAERKDFIKSCQTFDKTQDLEAYTSRIKDYILIWRRFLEGRACYTPESVDSTVKGQPVQIKAFFDEEAPVEDAAVDVDYCCG